MKTSHTPGPLAPACGARGTTCRHPSIIYDGGQVGSATWQGSESATDANARLMASAPDLLEACYSAMKDLMYVSQKFDVALGSFGQLDAAYRKATGEAISKQEG